MYNIRHRIYINFDFLFPLSSDQYRLEFNALTIRVLKVKLRRKMEFLES